MELDEVDMDEFLSSSFLTADASGAAFYPHQPPEDAADEASFRSRASTWDPSFKRGQAAAAAAAAATTAASPSSSSTNTDAASGFEDSLAAGANHNQLGRAAVGPLNSPRFSHHQASASAAAVAAQKRRNAWGNQSYAELITQAIQASPHGRLTLAEIYDWMVRHVPYFNIKSDPTSSAGWKNSVRHNLSLHNKFVRVQNDQSGKSSYWTINYEVRDRASYRRRAATADMRSGELAQKRQAVLAKQRARAAAAAAAFSEASPPRPSSVTPASAPATPLQQARSGGCMPRTLSVTEIIRDLVPPEQLLDDSRTTEDLLLESLTDALLQQACEESQSRLAPPQPAPPPPPSLPPQLQQPMVHDLSQQLNQLSCGQQLSVGPSVVPDSPASLFHHQQQQQQQQLFRQQSGPSSASWFIGDLVLPDIQEAVEQQPTAANSNSSSNEPPLQHQQQRQFVSTSSQLQPQFDFLMEELA